MDRRDPAILAFRVGPAASGCGLCDIDRVQSWTLNNTLSISHSPRPLAPGPTRNAEIMESVLRMRYSSPDGENIWMIKLKINIY